MFHKKVVIRKEQKLRQKPQTVALDKEKRAARILTGFPNAHARPNADMPRKLIIQYTTKVPFPYALGLIAGSVGLAGSFEKGT